MINARILAEISSTLDALHDATILPSQVRRDTLPGLLACSNLYLAQFPLETLAKEIDHLLLDSPITLEGRTYRGYARDDLLGAISAISWPSLASSTPADEDTDVSAELEAITLVFDQAVTLGGGGATLILSPSTTEETWTEDTITQVNATTLSLPLQGPLTSEGSYTLHLDQSLVLSIASGLPNLPDAIGFTVEEVQG